MPRYAVVTPYVIFVGGVKDMVLRRIALGIFCLILVGGVVLGKDVYVRGYFRKDGTYVRPHWRTQPDGYFWNNYSAYGNINPYTGKIGTKWPTKTQSFLSYSYKHSYTSPYVISPLSRVGSEDVFVRGYYKRDGTYVRPHFRTKPDGYFWNNYSAYGNVNPYTGEIGRKLPRYNYKSNYYGLGNTRLFEDSTVDTYRSLVEILRALEADY